MPDQTIRYCEKLTYAQIIVNANIILPRSWRCRPPRNSATGSTVREPHDRERRERERAEAPGPTMKMTPYIVEYQWGSSDMTQSTDVQVVVSA